MPVTPVPTSPDTAPAVPTTSARRILHRAHQVAGNIDQEPWSPHQLGRTWHLRIWERRKRQAAERSPIWKRREEQRTRTDGTYTVVGEGLAIDDFINHLNHFETLAPAPRYAAAAQALEKARLSRLSRRLLHAYDKLTRGWTRTDIANLDRHLSRTLGAQLIHLSQTGHAWPEQAYPTRAQWSDALCKNGSALLRYGNRSGLEALHPDGTDSPSTAGLAEQMKKAEAQQLHQAADALRWVADHLEYLWD